MFCGEGIRGMGLTDVCIIELDCSHCCWWASKLLQGYLLWEVIQWMWLAESGVALVPWLVRKEVTRVTK